MPSATEPVPSREPHRKSGAFWRRFLLWPLLLLPMLMAYERSEPARIMENLAIMSSQDTWMRVHAGEPAAWVIPSWNGQPRVNKPPLLVWVNLLAWTGLDPDHASLETLVARARLVAVGFMLLALLGTFWAGRVLTGDAHFAHVAACMTGTMLLFVKQSRYAAYDEHLLGWLAVSMAAALWAMRPRAAASPSRWAGIGWILSGLALGAAWLTKGPLALVLGLGPMVLVALALPERRGRALWGVGAVFAVAIAVAAPWYRQVLNTVPGAFDAMFFEYRAVRDEFQPPWYYLGFLGLAFPWTVPLVRGLLAPRDRTDPACGRGGWNLAWLWFAFVFVFMSIPGAKQQRYITPILPAAGLVAAWGWFKMSASMRVDRGWASAHYILIFVATLLGPAFLLLQTWAVGRNLLPEPLVVGVSPWIAAFLLPIMAFLAWIAWTWHRAGLRHRSASALVLWFLTLAIPLSLGYGQANHGRYPQKEAIFALDTEVAGTPLYYVPRTGGLDPRPSKEFLMYTRRVVPRVGENELQVRLASGEAFYVLVRRRKGEDHPALQPVPDGLILVGTINDGDREPVDLFRSPSARARQGKAPTAPVGHPYVGR